MRGQCTALVDAEHAESLRTGVPAPRPGASRARDAERARRQSVPTRTGRVGRWTWIHGGGGQRADLAGQNSRVLLEQAVLGGAQPGGPHGQPSLGSTLERAKADPVPASSGASAPPV